jgi:hypothetical protein
MQNEEKCYGNPPLLTSCSSTFNYSSINNMHEKNQYDEYRRIPYTYSENWYQRHSSPPNSQGIPIIASWFRQPLSSLQSSVQIQPLPSINMNPFVATRYQKPGALDDLEK